MLQDTVRCAATREIHMHVHVVAFHVVAFMLVICTRGMQCLDSDHVRRDFHLVADSRSRRRPGKVEWSICSSPSRGARGAPAPPSPPDSPTAAWTPHCEPPTPEISRNLTFAAPLCSQALFA